MYKSFYGFNERPFSKTPDPRFLYMAPQYEEALARLEYTIEEREIAVLTGEIGSGKTTISRALMDRNDSDHFVLMVNPRLTPAQFLRELALRLDLVPRYFRADLVNEISDKLFELHEAGKGVILLVDEAQIIPSKATFDEIRLLSNFQLDTQNLISILLIGQPELRKRFRHPAYAAFRQRIGMWYHLKALTAEETATYISHRLSVAGARGEIFTEGALKAIYSYSQGIPRLINNVCTNVLLTAFGRGERPIKASTVNETASELEP